MAKVLKTTFLLRRGTAEAWESKNPILQYGEPGYDKTNRGFKIGDGVTDWNHLEFISADESKIEAVVEKFLRENPVAASVVYTPHINADGTLTWTNNGGLENPEPVNIKGADGKDGKDGKDGQDGKDGAPGADYVLTEQDKQEIAGLVKVDNPEVDLSNYYTKEEVDQKIPVLDDYATKEFVTNKVNEALSGGSTSAGDVIFPTDAEVGDILSVSQVGENGKVVAVRAMTLQELMNSGNVQLPPATNETAGVVKGSTDENSVNITEEGTMEVTSLNVNKIVQTPGEDLILDCGQA